MDDLLAPPDVQAGIVEGRLRRALIGGHIVAWEWDVDTGRLTWSENVTEVLGLDLPTQPQFKDRITTGERDATLRDEGFPIGQPLVFLSVTDTGTGMSPEVLKKAWDPFFTTKDVGKGSGLGLAMVRGFAEQSAGRVVITSTEGVGTTVTILLPAVPARAGDTPGEAPKLQRGRERLLLVEDDPAVLQYATAQLLKLGYRVVAVANGMDALELLERDRDFDLLFTDVVLPRGLSGVQLAKRARQIQPKLRVLLTSGYPEEVFEAQGRPDPDVLLLRKPYRLHELAQVLRTVLA